MLRALETIKGVGTTELPKALDQCSIGPGLLLPDEIAEVDGLLVGQSPREATCRRANERSLQNAEPGNGTQDRAAARTERPRPQVSGGLRRAVEKGFPV